MKTTIQCGRCPVSPWLARPGSASYYVAGEAFPVGLLSLRLLTMRLLSQARRLGGLHRASPVPFRASYFTSEVPPSDTTAQRLTAYWYRWRSFPLIPSPRFVAHLHRALLSEVHGKHQSIGVFEAIVTASQHHSAPV